MNELRRKVLALLGSDIGREVLADVVIDVVARSLGRLGGRPRNGSPSPHGGGLETDTERPEMSNTEVSKPVSEPAGNPPVEGGGGVSGSLTLVPDLTPVSEPPRDRQFDEWWAAYPKKVGKADAQRAWKKHKPPLAKALETLAWQVKSKPWREGFVPNPATWLNGGRWEDQPPTAPTPAPTRPYHAALPEPTYNRPAPWPEKGAK